MDQPGKRTQSCDWHGHTLRSDDIAKEASQWTLQSLFLCTSHFSLLILCLYHVILSYDGCNSSFRRLSVPVILSVLCSHRVRAWQIKSTNQSNADNRFQARSIQLEEDGCDSVVLKQIICSRERKVVSQQLSCC